MLESRTRQTDTIETTVSNKTSQVNEKRTIKKIQNRSAALGWPAMKLLEGVRGDFN